MLELFLKLIEQVTNLVKARQTQSDRVFDEFYRPIFENMISVHQNYIYGVAILKEAIDHRDDLKELKTIVEKLRAEYLPIRTHLFNTATVLRSDKNNSLTQSEKDFLHSVSLYLNSYFDGRTPFTGMAAILDDLDSNLLTCGKDSDFYLQIVSARYTVDTRQTIFREELKRIQTWLEHQFCEISMNYNQLRLEHNGVC